MCKKKQFNKTFSFDRVRSILTVYATMPKATTLKKMKKYLVIFLLVLLPMQLSWAAVTSYCQHETGVSSKHLGHHSHEHTSIDNPSSPERSTNLVGLDHDCTSCHVGCAAALTSQQSILILTSSKHHPFDYLGNLFKWPKTPPDRPQWNVLA